MKKFAYIGAVLALSLCSVHPAQAGCTAQKTCQQACNLDLFCPAQFRNICTEVSCSWPATVISCSGNNACTVGSSSITCDGVVRNCPAAFICREASASVQCGSAFSSCATPCLN